MQTHAINQLHVTHKIKLISFPLSLLWWNDDYRIYVEHKFQCNRKAMQDILAWILILSQAVS